MELFSGFLYNLVLTRLELLLSKFNQINFLMERDK